MENLITLLFDIGLWTIYLTVILTVAILIQGIVYRTTGFSIYKFFVRKAILEEINK